MMLSVVKRALPFAMTLIVGTGLGSIFGFNQQAPKKVNDERVWTFSERRSGCRTSHRRRGRVADSTPVNIRFQPNTRYTPDALKNKTTGVVQLRVRFNADGTATVLERLSTLPDGLTEEAERVAERTQFDPATVNGQPVSVTEDKDYVFSLNDRVTMGL